MVFKFDRIKHTTNCLTSSLSNIAISYEDLFKLTNCHVENHTGEMTSKQTCETLRPIARFRCLQATHCSEQHWDMNLSDASQGRTCIENNDHSESCILGNLRDAKSSRNRILRRGSVAEAIFCNEVPCSSCWKPCKGETL